MGGAVTRISEPALDEERSSYAEEEESDSFESESTFKGSQHDVHVANKIEAEHLQPLVDSLESDSNSPSGVYFWHTSLFLHYLVTRLRGKTDPNTVDDDTAIIVELLTSKADSTEALRCEMSERLLKIKDMLTAIQTLTSVQLLRHQVFHFVDTVCVRRKACRLQTRWS
jgi:hypothetical protein